MTYQFTDVSVKRIPAIHKGKKTAVLYILLDILKTRPFFKKSEGSLFDKGSIDVKSVLTFEK